MDRQVSYNGPLLCSPLPCNLPASRPSSLMNHPLPLKPPTSKYFSHPYTTSRNPATPVCTTATQHVVYGKYLPVNNEPKISSVHHATAPSLEALSSPKTENVILLSSEDTFPALESDCDETGSINTDELPHPDTLFSWVWNNHGAGIREASVATRSVDDRSCHDETSSSTSEVCEISLSCESRPSDADDSGNDDNGPTKLISNERQGGLTDTLGPKILFASLVKGSRPTLLECRGLKHVTETTMGIMSKISR
ncbi:hypothetical protein AOCH_007112 [Aspergillus ochraceoroseus]|uniref:Uncharacterized protein n=1 Tax=Aspergillus ochraceoroseus TaxID=138278 RepID=A0A0F8W9E0_9EURO|nr:hypothetical protein AOCH_007112 [Aspergillus ochraceoroseus]